MNESSLAKSIDKLAKVKAEQLINEIWNKINQCLSPYWRHESANGFLIREDILNVLNKYVAHVQQDKNIQVQPTEELFNACRAKILDDLLKGLPKLKELADMAVQDEAQEEVK